MLFVWAKYANIYTDTYRRVEWCTSEVKLSIYFVDKKDTRSSSLVDDMFELDPFSQDLDDADLDDDIFSDDEDSHVPNYKSRTRKNTFSSAIVLQVLLFLGHLRSYNSDTGFSKRLVDHML